MSFVEDRWFVTVRDPDGTTRKERSPRYGQPMRYRARYTAPDGKERSRSFPDGKKREADAYVKAMSTDITRGTWTDPAGARMTLRAFAEGTWYPAQSSGPGRRKALRSYLDNHILPKLGTRTLGDLAAHPSVIQQWVRSLTVADDGARNIVHALSAILAAAVEDGLIPRNPCKSRAVRTPQRTSRKVIPWEAGRVAAIRAELPARYRAMVDCGELIGLRQGEVIGLSPDDIDWLRGIVHVRRQVRAGTTACFGPPKGGKPRDVPLAETAKLRLAAHVEQFPPGQVTLSWNEPGGEPVTARLLFTGERGAVIRASNFDERIWKPARDRAHIPAERASGFHALRHHYASVLLFSGVDIRTVSEMLGHADAGFTLATYAHLMPGAGDRVKKALDAAATDQPRTETGPAVLRRRSEP